MMMMRSFLAAAIALLLVGPPAGATNTPTLLSDAKKDCTLTATGTCAVATYGAGTATFNLSSSGASGLTYNFQGSSDGSHWFTLPYIDPTNSSPAFSYTTASATSGQWVVQAGGMAQVRFNLTAYSAGTLTVHAEAGAGAGVVYTLGGSISGSFTCGACALETGGNLATLAGAISSSKANTRSYFSIGNADTQPHVCGSTSTYKHITSATDTQLINASGSNTIYICDIRFSASAALNFYLEKSSTGTCGSPTQIDILVTAAANEAHLPSAAFYQGLNTGASQQLCVNTSGGNLDISVIYDQY